jgi:mevalonate kinase
MLPAKLLLLGEYSVLHGSAALAFPYERFSGELVLPGLEIAPDPEWEESNRSLKMLFGYLSSTENHSHSSDIIDLEKFEEELDHNLFFLSTIPSNYGVGSSGSLVAALYRRFGHKNETSPEELRKRLAFIESFFHSTSSGTDPLVCYLNRTVCIRDGKVTTPDITLDELRKHIKINLIDSGTSGQTKAGVSGFNINRETDPDRADLYESEYIPLVNQVINNIINKEFGTLYSDICKISELQLQLFTDLFPPSIREKAEICVRESSGAIKLCGSGGGGFYMHIRPVAG